VFHSDSFNPGGFIRFALFDMNSANSEAYAFFPLESSQIKVWG